MERTWEITDIDGANRRTVTLAQFMAEHALKTAAASAQFNVDCKRVGLVNPVARATKGE